MVVDGRSRATQSDTIFAAIFRWAPWPFCFQELPTSAHKVAHVYCIHVHNMSYRNKEPRTAMQNSPASQSQVSRPGNRALGPPTVLALLSAVPPAALAAAAATGLRPA